jgi:hypothetical protein
MLRYTLLSLSVASAPVAVSVCAMTQRNRCISMLLSELAHMSASIANAAKERQRDRDSRAAPGRLRAPPSDSPNCSLPLSSNPGQPVPDLRLPASLDGVADGARGVVGQARKAADEQDGGGGVILDEGEEVEEVKRGWLAYIWGDDDGDEEREEEMSGDEQDGVGPDRQHSSSTALILALSVPRAGFVFKCGGTATGSHQAMGAGGAGGGGDMGDRGSGAMLDVAGTGVTILFRQLKLEDPTAAPGGGLLSGGAIGCVEGQKERERERQVRGIF